ncbi:MAG: class I SAM-dependent methyltransferase [Proteobacteria bacterium]|nr:class I SAM-dependent methyltransferase [Pseudomonadota bacterium]
MTTTSDERRRDEGDTDFGFRRVRQEDHAGMVSAIFDSVADRYDLMNDLMSGGLHRLWKQALIDWLNPRTSMRLIDVAGGTGDVALRALERVASREGAMLDAVTICDPNYAMLRVAKRRAIDAGHLNGVALVCARAEALPVTSRAVSACTISFGLRNVTDRMAALSELHRVLDMGGHFLCLEFSPSVMPMLASLYDAYSYRVLPWLGERVAGDREAYQYLAESIRRFPDPETLAGEMRATGFGNVSYRALSGGIVAIHSGWRV